MTEHYWTVGYCHIIYSNSPSLTITVVWGYCNIVYSNSLLLTVTAYYCPITMWYSNPDNNNTINNMSIYSVCWTCKPWTFLLWLLYKCALLSHWTKWQINVHQCPGTSTGKLNVEGQESRQLLNSCHTLVKGALWWFLIMLQPCMSCLGGKTE